MGNKIVQRKELLKDNTPYLEAGIFSFGEYSAFYLCILIENHKLTV